jgi:ribosomal protein S18 acetylase RimI-like enzyme
VIELRPARWDDLCLLPTWITSPEQLRIWAGPSLPWPLTEPALRAYADQPSDVQLIWTAVTVPHAEPVGHACLLVREGGSQGRLSRVLVDPARRGEGLGRALVATAVRTAFAATGIDTLTLGVYRHNVAAVRLYESVGFTEVGRAPAAFEVDGERWTAIEMVLTRDGRNGEDPG